MTKNKFVLYDPNKRKKRRPSIRYSGFGYRNYALYLSNNIVKELCADGLEHAIIQYDIENIVFKVKFIKEPTELSVKIDFDVPIKIPCYCYDMPYGKYLQDPKNKTIYTYVE